MCFGNSGRSSIKINGNWLKTTNSFKYLGFIMEKRVKNAKHVRNRLKSMKVACGAFIGVLKALEGVTIDTKRNGASSCELHSALCNRSSVTWRNNCEDFGWDGEDATEGIKTNFEFSTIYS
ncbi:unnamed protein product [Blepharisma stoltei]|uniref:Uncharacterized protein n=1 Tax=Blepharisma stoltei TaxID=1481888 RepID=A0AAU9IDP8_9CILI|nr:unnamed protein product [Blepharisma stoltei]